MKTFFFTTLALCLPLLLGAQGTLTAYYAKVAFDNYQKGQLIVDTNDPFNRMVDHSQTKFKFEGDDTGEYYSNLILKSQVTIKGYQMSPLPVDKIGQLARFRSTDGYEVRLFKAHANGHRFFRFEGEDFTRTYDAEQTRAHQEFYAMCGVLKSFYNDEGWFFQHPLEVENGCLKLYVNGTELGYGNDVEGELRYRPYVMGFLEQVWVVPDSYGYDKPAFDAHGNLLTDLQANTDMPELLSIAWIESKNALYINGTLYYLQNDEAAKGN